MSTKTGDDKFAMPAFPDIGAGALDGPAARSGRDSSHPTVGQRALHSLRLLLVAVWLGAAVFFSAAVAPSAFAVLPSRELAGALVARTLTILNVGGVAVGALLLVGAFVGRRRGVRLAALLVEVLAVAALTGAAFVGRFVIASRMAALRAQMGKPIEEVAADDPLRVAFNALHGQSVTAMSVAIAAAVVALFLIARRTK